MSKPEVSIIIPTKDRLDLLQQCLAGIKDHVKTLHEVIVVDGGADSTGAWARQAGCRVVSLAGVTFAQANNAAVRVARGKHFWLLNNDIILQNDALAPLLRGARETRGLAGARLLYPNGLIHHAGVGFDMGGNPYNLWNNAPAEHPEVIKAAYPRAVTFACAVVPREAWVRLGGLDEGYFNSYEDVDFCLRAREAGYQVAYLPQATAVHLTAQTAGRYERVAQSWAHFKEKWLDTGRLWQVLGAWPFVVERGR